MPKVFIQNKKKCFCEGSHKFEFFLHACIHEWLGNSKKKALFKWSDHCKKKLYSNNFGEKTFLLKSVFGYFKTTKKFRWPLSSRGPYYEWLAPLCMMVIHKFTWQKDGWRLCYLHTDSCTYCMSKKSCPVLRS